MIKEFKNLDEQEQALLLKAPALVTILIAGADDHIDEKELAIAEKISKFRKISGDTALMHYYEFVHDSISDQLATMITSLPDKTAERNDHIAKELSAINSIYPKLNKHFAISHYKSLKSLAKNVAEASGGVVGFFSIGSEEKKLIGLPMLKDPS